MIKVAQPEKLYITADGPRDDRIGEIEKCVDVRQYVLREIDWPCAIKTLFRDKNLGCGKAVSEAITWFFSQESEGIILEDDCVPSVSFFPYCEELLERYRYDERIMHIAGHNPLGISRVGSSSYYFARIQHCWGWASWRRAWAYYSFRIEDLNEFIGRKVIQKIFDGREAQEYWLSIFARMANSEIDTWDYQWTYSIFKNGGYCINPTKNLISNIGFLGDGTHTIDANSVFNEQERYEIEVLHHPEAMVIDRNKSKKINYAVFDIEEKSFLMILKQAKHKIKKIMWIMVGK
jgi:hypothetical protein